MSKAYDVAEAKSKFSELLNRAAYGGERFLIRKRGKPIGAIVSADDLASIEDPKPHSEGIIAVFDRLGPDPEFASVMDEVYASRENEFSSRHIPFESQDAYE